MNKYKVRWHFKDSEPYHVAIKFADNEEAARELVMSWAEEVCIAEGKSIEDVVIDAIELIKKDAK